MMLSPVHPASLIASGGRDQDTVHIKSQTDDIDLDFVRGVRTSPPPFGSNCVLGVPSLLSIPQKSHKALRVSADKEAKEIIMFVSAVAPSQTLAKQSDAGLELPIDLPFALTKALGLSQSEAISFLQHVCTSGRRPSIEVLIRLLPVSGMDT